MNYVLDTVAFVRYLEGRLPSKVDEVYKRAERGEVTLFLPQIVIGEFMYLVLKKGLKNVNEAAAVREVLHLVSTSGYITPVDMDFRSWEEFLTLKVPELHDRMICAIAKSKGAIIITQDEEISNSGIRTLWG